MSFRIDIFCSKITGIGCSNPMITLEPLMENSNYLAWASSVELWCKGQGFQGHLTNNACVADEKAKVSEENSKVKAQWEKIDAIYYVVFFGDLLIPSCCPCFVHSKHVIHFEKRFVLYTLMTYIVYMM